MVGRRSSILGAFAPRLAAARAIRRSSPCPSTPDNNRKAGPAARVASDATICALELALRAPSREPARPALDDVVPLLFSDSPPRRAGGLRDAVVARRRRCRADCRPARRRRHLHGAGLSARDAGAQCDTGRGTGARLGRTTRSRAPRRTRRTADNGDTGARTGRDLNDVFPRRAEPAPPPKPNEFQRFVEGATGRLLPIFGSAFFADAADNFQSLDNVPVSADYTIGPGDEIVTRAWGSIDVDYRSTVDRNGMLNLPKVGSFNVAGVKAADLEKNLRAQICAALHQLRPLGLARPAARPARLRRRPGAAAGRDHAVEPVDAALGGGRRGRPERRPARCARSCCAATARSSPSSTSTTSWSRATSRRTCSSPPATSSSSSRPGRASRVTGSIDTPAIYELKSAAGAASRRAALRRRRAGARQSEPGPARAHRSVADARQALRRDVPARRRRPAEAAARRRRPDAAGDLAAVRERRHAEGPRRPAAALSVHARHAHPRPDSRSRCADHARLLSAQEPARAGHRRRGSSSLTRRPRPSRATARRAAALGRVQPRHSGSADGRSDSRGGNGDRDARPPATTERGPGCALRPAGERAQHDHDRSRGERSIREDDRLVATARGARRPRCSTTSTGTTRRSSASTPTSARR